MIPEYGIRNRQRVADEWCKARHELLIGELAIFNLRSQAAGHNRGHLRQR